MIEASLAESTLKQYNSALKAWWSFCAEELLDPYNSSISSILGFLTTLVSKGMTYGSLNTYRSAISLIVPFDLGDNDTVKRFFKGVSKLKPSAPKYKYTWDPTPVLNFLSSWYPHENLSLPKLSMKLAVLLALVTAQRVQTLSKIRISNIILSPSEILIKIPENIKTSAPNKYQPLLSIPYFVDQPNICVASVLLNYLDATRKLRAVEDDYLFITYRKPFKVATSQTLSRWIKMGLTQSGIDTSIFSSHSTRHAATSAALRKGLNIELIRQTAGWTQGSNVFAKFYNRPLVSKERFGDWVLDTVKNQEN